MKIGLVLAATPGYSETFFTSKIKGLQKQGHGVIIYTRRKESNFSLCPVMEAPKVYGSGIRQLIAMKWTFLLLIPSLGKVIRYAKLERCQGTGFAALLKKIYLNSHMLSAKVDWLHFGFATQALGSELVAKAVGAKMAVSFRGFDLNVYPIKHPDCYKLLWKEVDKVHSISNYLLKRAWEMGLTKAVPYQVITPAVMIEQLPKGLNDTTHGELKFVTIARYNWIKGLDVGIEAMKHLKNNGLDFEYHIVGGGAQKEYERYAFQAHQSGLQNELVFHGKVSHEKTLSLLAMASIYIQPSLNEGFCNAVLEAQAMGKLCVVSNAGGLPENIKDGVSGWLFETGNAIELAKRINEVLELTAERKAQVSSVAKSRVREHFSIEKQQIEFVSFYTEDL